METLGPWEIYFGTCCRNQGHQAIKDTATIESSGKFSWILFQKLIFYFIFCKKMAHNNLAFLDKNNEPVQELSYWKKQTEIENLSLVKTSFCTLNVETECFNLLVSRVQATLQSLKIQKQQGILEILSWLGVLILPSACLPTNITPFYWREVKSNFYFIVATIRGWRISISDK